MTTPEFSERLSRLSPAAREMVEARLRGRRGTGGIPRLPAGGPPVLWFAQERMWFLQAWDRDSLVYNRAAAFRLRGPLDRDALERSVAAIIARHDALRATFSANDGIPSLTTAASPQHSFRSIDADSEEDLDAAIRHEARRPFDLSSDALLRATLFRTPSAEAHVLLLVSHHIAADRWSDAVLYGELEQLYAAGGHPATAGLRDRPIAYADFAAWQGNRATSPAPGHQQQYWITQLRDAPHFLPLPTDRPRPAELSFDGATYRFTVDPPLVDRLRTVARDEGVTLFVALLTAFACVVQRWTERDEFVIGTPVAERSRVQTESLIGCFVNTLALRIDLASSPTFRDALRAVRQTVVGALANAELPFERVIEAVAPQRSLSHSPLVQVMFALQNTPQRKLVLRGVEVDPLPCDTAASKLDLSFEATEIGGGLSCAIEFNTALFDELTIVRLADRWRTMLSVAAEDAAFAPATLPLLSPDEQTLLEAWNATDAPILADACIHLRVEHAAERMPHALAVIDSLEQLTYRELDVRANQLANFLVHKGAAPGTLVGIAIERSADLIVALLAVLKSGAAYVPLDREYPDAHLAAIASQAHPVIIVTDRDLPQVIAAETARVVNLQSARERIAAQSCIPPPIEVSSDAIAYVLFTSGSTGTPKGVMMPHEPVCNRIDWLQRAYPILATDRVLHHTSIGFDVSVGEIFCTLAAGATLVLADPGGHRDPAYLARLIGATAITVIDVVPRMLQGLLDEPAFDGGGGLRQVHCGAEVLPPAVAQRFFTGSRASLLNFYGPTETCIDVAVWPCRPDADDRSVPIGRPMSNVRVHILDRHQQPVSIGQPGEIYIGGRALAAGYLNRPDLTAAAFIPNPIDPEFSPRLYRTGDIGRYRSDGAIEFMGRRDRQIKVRGMRIELAEIEAAARALPEVVECTLVVQRGGEDDPVRVIAYIQSPDADHLQPSRLKARLAERVPDNMVPAIIVPLRQLPRTPGGKIDVAALPPVTLEVADPHHAEPLCTADEHTIAVIFGDVLGIADPSRLHAASDFFSLGGHSLAAARVAARIKDAFGVTLPLRMLFEAPTVRALAAAVRAGRTIDDSSRVPQFAVAMNTQGSRQPFFFLHAATEGEAFYSEQLGRLLGPDQAYHSLAPLGLDGAPIPTTVSEIARRYVAYICEHQPAGPYWLGGFCMSGPVAFEIGRQLREYNQTVGLVLVIESRFHNFARHAQLAERAIQMVGRALRLDSRTRMEAFLAAKRLTAAPWPARPDAGAERSEAIRQHYYRAGLAYVPYRADFPLAHLKTAGAPGHWFGVSSHFSEQVIPGNHDTCVTDEIQALARTVGRCLEDARGRLDDLSRSPHSVRHVNAISPAQST